MKYYLAIDIGASSGRHVVGWEEAGELKTDEAYRFSNGMKEENGHLVWDVKSLFENVVKGIEIALRKYERIQSLAIDTWGVDYVLMNGETEILPCYAYRDNRTETAVEKVHELVPFKELYERTGIQFQTFNSIYQLYADSEDRRLSEATDFLMMPEYLSYKLTGIKMHEYTNATTTGLVNARTGTYDREIIERLALPVALFKEPFKPQTRVGRYKGIEVVLCASHDTASAAEGIPMEGNHPYLSSGTWSLLGLKTPQAIINERSRSANFSNEGGAGYIRYQKNIMGMWLVNRLRDELCPEKPFSQIIKEARESPFEGCVDVNDDAFLAPESMKEAFDYALEQKPQAESDYFRCAFLSLAKSYKRALDELTANTGATFDTLYIAGGGAKNGFLNELTEEVCNLKVKAFPIEATALGNLKIQIGRK